ncbi:DUF3558 family protein [Antrihabitans spumae]|uniref:DUF3558 family protein n=1 Tax=Antrihabitans spumae TaxID=3373370 RepID=A0ABW7K0P1_9NOCA
MQISRITLGITCIAALAVSACSSDDSGSAAVTETEFVVAESVTATSSPATAAPERLTFPDATSAAGALSTEGPCALLTAAEIAAATGDEPTYSSVVRKTECRWQPSANDPTPIVDVETEAKTADEFETEKTLYGDPTRPAPNLGSDSFIGALDQAAYWLQGGTMYKVWIQVDLADNEKERAAIELAEAAAGRVG